MMKRWICLALLALAPCIANAFGLDQLQEQLRAAPIVRGQFVQQKFLRSLPQPLTSRGDFTLAQDKGLLWKLTSPFAQDLRITPQGIAKRDEQGQWQALPQQMGASRETDIFLAVLAGDTRGLKENFDITLTGDTFLEGIRVDMHDGSSTDIRFSDTHDAGPLDALEKRALGLP